MKGTTRDFLDEYRHSDITKRLHLYLQYPELRPEFGEMDRNEPPLGARSSMPGAKRLPRSHACAYSWLMPGFVKRHCRATLSFL